MPDSQLPTDPPVRLAIVGMGGFAASHHQVTRLLEKTGEARLVCTCDPQPDRFAAKQAEWELEARGVRVYDDYRAMLAAHAPELECVVLPTPIPLHAEMHRAVVEAGPAVYLEKPPTLDHAELEEMIRVDARARRATQVGFNFIVEPLRRSWKARLAAGEFGAVRAARLDAQWPRATSYFRRNDWAGRLLLDGRLVLDSCLGNAMAHFVHNLFFWLGAGGLDTWGTPAWLEARLGRAHAIEGADTFFVAGETMEGTPFRMALTHACTGPHLHAETVECERATITYRTGVGATIAWHDGRREEHALDTGDLLAANHRDFYRYLRGRSARPATRLEDCRPFVLANNLVYLAARRITQLTPPFIREHHLPDGAEHREIPGFAGARDRFFAAGVFPDWLPAGPARRATAADLPSLRSVIESMAAG